MVSTLFSSNVAGAVDRTILKAIKVAVENF